MKPDISGHVKIATQVQNSIKRGKFDTQGCTHLEEIKEVTPSAKGCEECLQIGDRWVHLRICLTCGHVGCCDQSKNKHATKHFHSTQHPMIASFERGEDWLWCYPEELFFQV
jgi:uncharacterized UBP type Zn finger protein